MHSCAAPVLPERCPSCGRGAGGGTRNPVPLLQNQVFWWEKALLGSQTRLFSRVKIPVCRCKPELESGLAKPRGWC